MNRFHFAGSVLRRAAFVASVSGLLMVVSVAAVLAQATCCPPPCGRVAWWTGDATASDSLGRYDGMLVNGATYAPGRHGLAFSLDGVDDRIDLGSEAIIGDGFDPFTVCMWVNLASAPASGQYIFFARFRHETQFLLGGPTNLGLSGSFIGATFRGALRQWWRPISWNTFVGRWAHLAAVYTGGDKNAASSYQVYVDGQLLPHHPDPQGFVAGTNNDNGLGFDPFPGTGRAMLDGRIDDVQIFNRALSAAEIASVGIRNSCASETGLWMELSGRHQTRAGLETTYWINYANFGLQYIDQAAIVVTASANAEISHSVPLAWSVAPITAETPARSVAFMLYNLAPGEQGAIPIRLRAGGGDAEATLTGAAWIVPPVDSIPAEATVLARAGGGHLGHERSLGPRAASLGPAATPDPPPRGSVVFQFPIWFNPFGTAHMGVVYYDDEGLLGAPGSVWVWQNLYGNTHFTSWQGFSDRTGLGWQGHYTPPLAQPDMTNLQNFLYSHSPQGGDPLAFGGGNLQWCHWAVNQAFQSIGKDLIPGDGFSLFYSPGYIWFKLTGAWWPAAGTFWAVPGALRDFFMAALTSVGLRRPFAPRLNIAVVRAWDPNEKIGPEGTGTQHYLRADERLQYAVFFENDPDSASAAARTVVVRDTLDMSEIDVGSLALGPIAVGSTLLTPPPGLKSWSTRLDLPNEILVDISAELDSLSGVVSWAFTTLDSTTGLPPEDPLLGFLPLNVTPPEGEGHVVFSVMPVAGLATEAQLRNRASIVFDTNPQVMTPAWVNTIDAQPPFTSVAELDSIQGSVDIQVHWSGDDTGAGGTIYSVYVSENGGPFAPWIQSTTETSAAFVGSPGKTYSFYCQGLDAVGNLEVAPVVPDAVTRIPHVTDAGPRPFTYRLYACYPNPFNPMTRIRYELARRSSVSLGIYDVAGRLVRRLVRGEELGPGNHSVLWDGLDDSGHRAASGVYFYRLKVLDFTDTRKMVLLK